MYLFGGSSPTPNQQLMYVLDLKSMKWDVIHSRGDVPQSRDDHTAILYEGSMVIFGGYLQTSSERTNDIHRYHFKDNKWEKITVLGRDLPVPRAGHSGNIIGD